MVSTQTWKDGIIMILNIPVKDNLYQENRPSTCNVC